MIFTIPLNPGVTLSNVRYRWIANGVETSASASGITQPLAGYPVFRISADPPSGAEEIIAFDVTNTSNWNVGNYLATLRTTSGTTTTTIDNTNCAGTLAQFIDNTLQMLEPCPAFVYQVAGSGDGTGEAAGPSITEHGLKTLPIGLNTGTVTFGTQKVSADYEFDELAVENSMDSTWLSIDATFISRTANGFAYLLDALPDTANYKLRWKVTVNQIVTA